MDPVTAYLLRVRGLMVSTHALKILVIQVCLELTFLGVGESQGLAIAVRVSMGTALVAMASGDPAIVVMVFTASHLAVTTVGFGARIRVVVMECPARQTAR